MFDIPAKGVPLCLKYVSDSHDTQQRYPNAKELLYGTEDGVLIQLLVETSAVRQGFIIPNPQKLGAIRSIFSGIGLQQGRFKWLDPMPNVNHVIAWIQILSLS